MVASTSWTYAPSRQAGSAPRRVEPCPTNYLRLCSNEQLLELLAWFGLTGNDEHFADIVDDDIIDVNDVSPCSPRASISPLLGI